MIRAELRKIRSTRTLLAAPVVAVVYAVLAMGPALTLPAAERRAQPPDTLLSAVRGPGSFVAVLMLLLGVLVAAGEFRHGTVAATLLVTPRRWEVLRAKAFAVALVAAGTALAMEAVAVSFGTWFVRANDIGSTVSAGDVAATVVAVVAVAILYGVAGVGLGLAIREQTGAVVAALVWVTVAEGVLPIVLRSPGVVRWLPGGAAEAMHRVAKPPADLLPAWGGALVLAAVAAALVAAAYATFTRRDVGTTGA